MTHQQVRALFICFVLSASVAFTSCKGKSEKSSENTSATETTTTPATAPVDTATTAPVNIASDDALKAGVQDATKDYKGVKTEVANGEITLTGTVKRSQLPALMMALNSLKPKKINNNLTTTK
jgi:hypothetical protein